jgi:hypothetical protein
MLAGLIFATQDAADRADALAATLPFGGATLIEFQARLLIAAGASQILIAVARVTPELLGAAARIRKRGVAVDVVRSAAEASAKVHPLARVVVLADGLVTNEAILAPMAEDGEDLLLVTDRDGGLERIDATSLWAGVARVSAQRLADAAQLPRDYDFLSTLLRVAAQRGAARLMLPAGAEGEGHGVEHESRGLARRGRGVFAALAGTRVPWVERWILGPLARFALPPLVARGASPLALIGAGAAVAAAGAWAIWHGWIAAGLGGVTLACALFLIGGMLAWLRGDESETVWADRATQAFAAAAILLSGIVDDRARAATTGIVLALAVIVAAGLVERIRALAPPRRWWAGASTYPLLLIPFAALGQTLTGLAALALYAALTLLGGIEDARAKP